MELFSLAQELLQSGAERAASYRAGQVALRHADRALWALEKSARWAVPPPLDADERAQPELVRPLPWVFFLMLLVTLRITRESISLLNLVMGKPPLRSADVVTYIQSKRRYLRTLKYQGNRLMRARSAGHPRETWYTQLQTMLEFTMCFRRPCANNNTTHVANNEEVLVVKRNKRGRDAAAAENTMERLIERMMVDLDADSDDDSSYTLTNPASKSDSDISVSDKEVEVASAGTGTDGTGVGTDGTEGTVGTSRAVASSTPNKDDSGKNTTAEISPEKTNSIHDPRDSASPDKATRIPKTAEKTPPNNQRATEETNQAQGAGSTPKGELENNGNHSDRAATETFLESERPKKTPKKSQKIANGRTIESSQSKKRENSRRGHRTTYQPLN